MMIFDLLGQYAVSPGHGGLGGSLALPLVFMFGTMILGLVVNGVLRARFAAYSKMPTDMTGAQVAELMLRQNGIRDVRVVSIPGQLTDHYDPSKKTVNLSEGVYGSNSVAAVAVAAHECGHAVQHHRGYVWLGLRSMMVPAVQVASSMINVLMWLLIFGAFVFFAKLPILIYIFLGAVGLTVVFSLVTLPVEFDASRRALDWLRSGNTVGGLDYGKAKNALFWAAMTYVAGALAAVAQLLYWAALLLGDRR